MVTLQVENGELPFFVPMQQSDAQTFLRARTQWGMENRSVYVALTLKADATTLAAARQRLQGELKASLQGIQVFADRARTQRLALIGEDEINKLVVEQRRVAAEKQADEQAAALEAQKTRMMQAAGSLSKPAMMANWLNDSPDLQWGRTLDTIRAARLSSVVTGAPVTATLLVQVEGSGKDKVPTRWPGHLRVSVGKDGTAFSSGQWYLISGQLSVSPSNGTALSDALLDATKFYACHDAQCAETTDPVALSARKLSKQPQINR
ncbi:hypothetical protein GCM10007207_27540 [Asaia siamensis]|uniref:Uncharacterized protein n=2 Tax=Asaia siamensis TaxID=110479 RepID=A0ABQ1MH48_9PROT|nr:hypothetical protein AA0323_1646 [Asaia siamensis NRIC 0323]GGC40617.1 hypothetical protein GCM10007207_27540 [Asaia siamensis]